MPFTPINVVNGTTPANATWGNLVQTQYTEATLSFDPDLFTAFVLSGLVATKDGSVANQLDVTGGTAYLKQADNTLRQRVTAASTPGQFVTSTINTTYYLFLLNTGTFQWSTTSTGPANSLAICQATTDGSGNILVVTDKRTLVTRLLPGVGTNGMLAVPLLTQMGPIDTTSGNQAFISTAQDAHSGKGWSFYLMQDGSLLFNEWTSGNNPLRLSPTAGLQVIGGQATAGSFGAPVIVAQTLYVTVSVTTMQTILSFTPAADGDYRVSATALLNGTLAASPALLLSYTEPLLGGTPTAYFMTTGQSGAMTVLSGSQPTFTPPASLPCPPITIRAKGGTPITVKYQDAVGTPNDRVSAFIERLS